MGLLAVVLAWALVMPARTLTTVPQLAVDQYLGRWYLMYTSLTTLVFQSRYCVQAQYGLFPNGSISVHNSDRPAGIDGPLRTIDGYAVQSSSEPGQLQVFFPGSPMAGSYWIVALGPADSLTGQYPWAIVSDARQGTLFVLARDPATFSMVYDEEVRALVRSLGFDRFYNSPLPVVQTGCPAESPPR